MSKFAYVENGKVLTEYDSLPKNWKNYSNFYALESNKDFLSSLGWLELRTEQTSYDKSTQKLGKVSYRIDGNIVYKGNEVIDLPPVSEPEPVAEKTEEELQAEKDAIEAQAKELLERDWQTAKTKRDELMNATSWRYERYARETRMGVETTDDISYLDEYMQALADITKVDVHPNDIVWPELKLKG